jgi:DnaJ-class molecular chaperone
MPLSPLRSLCATQLVVLVCMLLTSSARAFLSPHTGQSSRPLTAPVTPTRLFVSAHQQRASKKDSFLLDDFRLSNGDLLDPYKTLKVPRTAPRSEIKKSYYTLSRRYHPDGVRHRTILPGSCNNLDEVRDEWERIRWSYEILNNEKTRKRYDRHEALADPGAALQRAAVNAAFQGAMGMGKGLFGVGAFAVKSMIKTAQTQSKAGTASTTATDTKSSSSSQASVKSESSVSINSNSSNNNNEVASNSADIMVASSDTEQAVSS